MIDFRFLFFMSCFFMLQVLGMGDEDLSQHGSSSESISFISHLVSADTYYILIFTLLLTDCRASHSTNTHRISTSTPTRSVFDKLRTSTETHRISTSTPTRSIFNKLNTPTSKLLNDLHKAYEDVHKAYEDIYKGKKEGNIELFNKKLKDFKAEVKRYEVPMSEIKEYQDAVNIFCMAV